MNQSLLISFSRPHRILALSLVSLFVLLVGLGIHQYSLPAWSTLLEDDSGGGILFGVPQAIRLDDWSAEIPLMLSQLSHKPPFPVINTKIGYGTNQLAPLKIPVRHILTFFKPTTWGFFLGADAGLAWMWWSMVLGFFYAFFLLFMLISRNRFFLSAMGSLLLLFSPFFQFWSMHGSEIPIFMALAFVSFAYLTFSADKKVMLANGVLLGWFLGCFMLNSIYPPYQVALVYLFLFLAGGFIASRRSELDLRRSGTIRLAGFSISVTIVVFAAAVFYLQARDVINILAGTVYPGIRFSTGGDFEPWKLFSNTFLIHLYVFFQHGAKAPRLVDWADMRNICEYSSFIFTFPVLISVFLARCIAAKKIIDPLSFMIGGYIIIILVYMFFGFPDWLSRYSGFSRTPAFREPIALGVANAALLVAMLSKPIFFGLSPKIKISIVSGWALLLLFSAMNLYSKWPAAPLPYLVAASFAVALASYLLLCDRFTNTTLAVLVLLSLLSTGWFNPLVKGGSKIFSENPLCREILDIDALDGGASRWVTFSNSQVIPNLFRILGVNSLDGTYPYPQFELWKKLDPLQKALRAYNRYGSAIFIPVTGSKIIFSLSGDDFFKVGIDPETDVLHYLGVTHCLVTGKDTSIFDRSPNLQQLYSYKNNHIYEVIEPKR
jgi:hypothetical protein